MLHLFIYRFLTNGDRCGKTFSSYYERHGFGVTYLHSLGDMSHITKKQKCYVFIYSFCSKMAIKSKSETREMMITIQLANIQ